MPTWLNMLLYAAVCGGVGALAHRIVPDSSVAKRLITTVAVAAAIPLTTAFIRPWVADLYADLTASTPREKYLRAAGRVLRNDPVMAAWAKKSGESEGAALTLRGLKRLSVEQLVRRVGLVSRMLNKVPDGACEGFATGKAKASDMEAMLGVLTDSDIQEYAELAAAAAAAELRGGPIVLREPGEADFAAYLRPAIQDLSDEDAARLGSALDGKASPKDSCWAMRLLYRRADAAEGSAKAALAVILAWNT